METNFTLRNSPHRYLQLRFTTHAPGKSSGTDIDEITIKTHLNSALSQYLGLTGTAIDIDILKVDCDTAWIKLPSEDESAVVAALSQWAGQGGVAIRVQGRSSWLGALTTCVDDEKLWSLEG